MSLTRGLPFLFLQLHSISRRPYILLPIRTVPLRTRTNTYLLYIRYGRDASRHEYESSIFHTNRRTEKYWWLREYYRVICKSTMQDLVPPCQWDQQDRSIPRIDASLSFVKPGVRSPYHRKRDIALSERTYRVVSTTSTRSHIQYVTHYSVVSDIVTCQKGQVRLPL